jgi:glycerol-3-phosphate dehydrogenase
MSDGVLAFGKSEPALLNNICQRLPDIGAQVMNAVANEMAMTLEDVVFRRTGLGTLGPLDGPSLQTVAGIMARELKWSPVETQRQIASLDWRYKALASA